MCSLVAAYSDSDSETESDSVNQKNEKDRKAESLLDDTKGNNVKAKDDIEDEDDDYIPRSGPVLLTVTSFDGDSEDDDDEEEEDEEEISSVQSESKPRIHLSNPFRESSSSAGSEKHESVFEIPFLDQEIKKSAALERHVKMTQTAGTQEMINGKKICWNYRKGRCRFGHNCTFAHDSDIQQIVEKSEAQSKSSTSVVNVVIEKPIPSEPYDESAVVVSSPHLGHGQAKSSLPSRVIPDTFSDEDTPGDRGNEGIGKKGKKRRPGLSTTLTPGKKVMKTYYEQQHKGSNNS